MNEYGIPYRKYTQNIRGYGLGLPEGNPYKDETAVKGMYNRVQQVLDKAEELGEKNNITLDETDRFIIVAMAQNGPGFDLDDIRNVMNQPKYHTNDGQINWDAYFEEKQDAWNERVSEAKWWDIGEQRIISKTNGSDFDTKFCLKEFYEKSSDLASMGYYLPENLDTQAIENLIAGYPSYVGGQ